MRALRLSLLLPVFGLAACAGDPAPAPSKAFLLPPGDELTSEEIQQITGLQSPDGAVADPKRLKGLNGKQVKAVLGQPEFRRRDAPAEIWQYRGRACTLDVFLYDEGKAQMVAHYAVRSRVPIGERECMEALTGRGSAAMPTS